MLFDWVPCDAVLSRTAFESFSVSSNPNSRSVMSNREYVRRMETSFMTYFSASRMQYKEPIEIEPTKHVVSYKITILHFAPDESSVLKIFFEFRLLHKLGFVLNYI